VQEQEAGLVQRRVQEQELGLELRLVVELEQEKEPVLLEDR
jgi:hypothetical protein